MKKWKIAGLVASQIVLTYAVFIVCIKQPKSNYQQIEEAVGRQQSQLRAEASRLNSIIFKYIQQPTSITIEETRKAKKPNIGTALQSLKAEDVAFLMGVVNGK